jgi:hypothetical protein
LPTHYGATFEPRTLFPSGPTPKAQSADNVVQMHKASRSIITSGPDVIPILLWYIDPDACYGSEYMSNEEDICPDYIHPSLLDEV